MNKIITNGVMIAAVCMLFIVPFMDRPWLSYTWQLPSDDHFVVHTNVLNWQPESQDDIYMTIHILDLGIYQRSDRFDMDTNSADARTFYILKPRHARGEYLAEIRLYGEHSRLLDKKYTYLNADSQASCCY